MQAELARSGAGAREATAATRLARQGRAGARRRQRRLGQRGKAEPARGGGSVDPAGWPSGPERRPAGSWPGRACRSRSRRRAPQRPAARAEPSRTPYGVTWRWLQSGWLSLRASTEARKKLQPQPQPDRAKSEPARRAREPAGEGESAGGRVPATGAGERRRKGAEANTRWRESARPGAELSAREATRSWASRGSGARRQWLELLRARAEEALSPAEVSQEVAWVRRGSSAAAEPPRSGDKARAAGARPLPVPGRAAEQNRSHGRSRRAGEVHGAAASQDATGRAHLTII